MPKIPYRQHHLLEMLDAYEQQHLPLDLFMSLYFKAHRALGSKDRAYLAEMIYGMVRWKGLLDYLAGELPTWEKRAEIYSKIELVKLRDKEEIPLHIRLSFPENLWNLLVKTHGLETAQEVCRVCNQPAPTTVRANAFKITREDLLKKWKG